MQNVFKRYELKYIITEEQKKKIVHAMEPYMKLDKYGRTVIRNIYFDTDNYRLARRSIEKPVYKEKLRIRSYKQATPDSVVFVELKKKYQSIVYKRRISMKELDAMKWICDGIPCEPFSQISEEINYFVEYYRELRPKVFLTYEREAFYSLDKSDFRVTFDDNILCRQENISLEADIGGVSILEDNKILMEIKTSRGIPMWMVRLLSEEHIYKTSFSKYGKCYETIIYPQIKNKNGVHYV